MDAASLDPRLPVLIGGGQINNRVDQGADPLDPIELMTEAVRRAAADTGATDPAGLLASADTVAGVQIFSWRYTDPAALLAQQIGASPRRRWHTGASGSSPMQLVHRLAAAIAAGESDLAVIAGGEPSRSRQALRLRNEKPDWYSQPEDQQPTDALEQYPLASPDEMARGVLLPVQIYPLFETALRAEAGRSPHEHLVHLSELWAGFSAVAAENPDAWIRRRYTAQEIRTPGPTNRMVGYPYTKLMNSNSSVEQGAALVLCSVERARALGISPDRWVFPWGGGEAHDTYVVSERPALHRSPAIAAAGRAALDLAGVGIDDLAHLDVYSCFPSAVQVAAAELGLGLDRPLTVTGGLSFAGGPWNDYVTHSLATMMRVLRSDPGSAGMVTANGGYLTSHAIGVFGTEPPPSGRFRWVDVQAEVDAAGSVEADFAHQGPVTVEAVTVTHSREGDPENGIAFARTPDGRRTLATTRDPAAIKEMLEVETVGRPAEVTDGTLHL